MIRVTVEILPGGCAKARRTIALMHISNISDLARRSDYRVDLAEAGNPLTGARARACTVYVRNHDRKQSIWSLIERATSAVNSLGGNVLD